MHRRRADRHIRPRRFSRAIVAAATVSAGVLLTVLGGCNILGPAIYFVGGPGKVEAVYKLDPERPTVVFVDDRAGRVPSRPLRQQIGDSADEALAQKRVVETLLSSRLPAGIATRDRFEEPMGIAEIGRLVEAEVIIYATVDAFTLSHDGQSYTPTAVLRVKIVDAVSGDRLWPEEPTRWHTLTAQGPPRATLPTGSTESRVVQRELAQKAGLELAKLFYSYEREVNTTRVGGEGP